MFQKAVLAVNFSEPLSKIQGALGFLRSFGTRVVVLHHVVSGAHTSSAERKLSRLTEALEPRELELETKVSRGSPATAIDLAARNEQANLICVPWKRKSWIQRSLVGSTTKDLVRLTDLPVFVYKHRSAPESFDSGLGVLYATALQERDETILPYLSYEGLQARRLVLLHVGRRAPDPEAEQRREDQAILSLSRLASEVELPDREVRELSITGNAKRLIPRVARRESADLIVLGKSEAEGIISGVLGSTAEEVAYSAAQSVLIIGREASV